MAAAPSKHLSQENPSILQYLEKFPLFQSLSSEALRSLVPLAELKSYPAGAEILTQGQINNKIFFLLRGEVSVYANDELILKLQRQGDIFGEMSVISDEPCAASIITDMPTDVFSICIPEMQAILQGNRRNQKLDEVHNTLYQVFSIMLTEKLAVTTNKAEQYEVTNRRLLQAQDEIRREKDFSESLIHSSIDGIFAFDREYHFTVWNPGMERMFRMYASNVLGKNAFDLFPELQGIGEDHNFMETLEGKQVIARDRPYQRPDGRMIYFEAYYSPLHNSQNEIVGGLAIIRDITQRKQAQEELLVAKERESELRTASLVQQAMLPKILPRHPKLDLATFFQSASETGGDWYGFMTKIPDKFIIMIGDVTGHGMPAALLTASASATCNTMETMYATRNEAPGPIELLTHLNATIAQAGGAKFLMTFFLAEIDLTSGEMRFANAGHNFPLLVRPGEKPKPLLNANSCLGSKPHLDFSENTVQLQKEDLLFFYTDGLIENTNTEDEMWGAKRLMQSLKQYGSQPAQQVVDQTTREAYQFHEHYPIDDDITVIACRILHDFHSK